MIWILTVSFYAVCFGFYDRMKTCIYKEVMMANVKKAGEVYKCSVCGNVVEVKEVGGGELVCCGKPMEKIKD